MKKVEIQQQEAMKSLDMQTSDLLYNLSSAMHLVCYHWQHKNVEYNEMYKRCFETYKKMRKLWCTYVVQIAQLLGGTKDDTKM